MLIALITTAVWSLISRRESHPLAYSRFRLLMRFALGATMVRYGLGKVIPMQMPTVFLSRLVEPFGNFSPMGVLWTSIGSSPAYESFTGTVELLGGVLMALILIAPYTGNLFDLLLRHRPLTPVEEPPVGRTPARRRKALIAQAVYGALIVLLAFSASMFAWSRSGAGAPKSPLFGIWKRGADDYRRRAPPATRDR